MGGFSALDSANLSNYVTVFGIYDDWNKRPAGLTQAGIITNIQERVASIRNGDFRRDAAVADSRPRNRVRLPDGSRRSRQQWTPRIAEGDAVLLDRAQSVDGFLRLGFTTFSDNSPQIYLDINRTMAESFGVTGQ